ncbi:hypothetical protein [Acinetobacter baumannii]|uniref:hypothetical protein n=2 Tax=Acinetobacter baumannii TaxID=470 RepID=UPI00208E8707|nr:hypothetical protein [Acinetobacter baumannii]
MSKKKEPAMSEFKVGDKVVLKNSSQDKVMVIQDYSQEFIRAYWDNKHYSFAHERNFRPATLAESRIGCRIDNPCKCCNGHGEVGNMFESFVCPDCNDHRVEHNDMGDDSHIENHISQLCKSKDV